MKDIPAILNSLKKLEGMRGSVPTYFFFGSISAENFLKVQQDLIKIREQQDEVDIVLESFGGSADYGYRLIRTFRKKYKVVNVIVPSWAKSAATLFALGATRLVMHEHGELGPIDTQVWKDSETDPDGEWEAALNIQASLLEIESRAKEGSILTYRKLRSDTTPENAEVLNIGRRLLDILLEYSAQLYKPLLENIDTNELGKRARDLNVGKMYGMRILEKYWKIDSNLVEGERDEAERDKNNKIGEMIDELTYECPHHGYVIDYDWLHEYLPFVQKSSQAPFTSGYDDELEALSILLMGKDDKKSEDIVGFVKQLTSKSKSATIEANEQHQTSTTDSAPVAAPTTQTRTEPVTRPRQNSREALA